MADRKAEAGLYWIITGGAGFLGNTLVRQLVERGEHVRVLALDDSANPSLEGLDCEVVVADVTKPETLIPAFQVPGKFDAVVVHCAGIVSIAGKVSEALHRVNVGGTEAVIDACRSTGVKRLIYISTVHAIPEPIPNMQIVEVDDPASFNPEKVVGEYAKTKAQATAMVLAAMDLDRLVIHPSGLIGPNDFAGSHLASLIHDTASGKLRAVVRGGYDFVDVRDVAWGIIKAARTAPNGRTYILSGSYISAVDLLELVANLMGKPRQFFVLPLWLAKAVAPLAEVYYKVRDVKPLFTRYSLYTLNSPSNFSHQRATKELGFSPRPLQETLEDTINWMGLSRQPHKVPE